MKEIKKWVKNNKIQYVEYKSDDAIYFVCPEFIIFKYKNSEEYFVSFCIENEQNHSIRLFLTIQSYFLDFGINFIIYDDCILSVENGMVEYFEFGDEARSIYYNFIHSEIEEQMKNPTYH